MPNRINTMTLIQTFIMGLFVAVSACHPSPVENELNKNTQPSQTGIRIPNPPKGHPRLYLSVDDIADLKIRMESSK